MGVEISVKDLEGIKKIRDSGKVYMFNYAGIKLVNEADYYSTVSWMYENKVKYGTGILEGFKTKKGR